MKRKVTMARKRKLSDDRSISLTLHQGFDIDQVEETLCADR